MGRRKVVRSIVIDGLQKLTMTDNYEQQDVVHVSVAAKGVCVSYHVVMPVVLWRELDHGKTYAATIRKRVHL